MVTCCVTKMTTALASTDKEWEWKVLETVINHLKSWFLVLLNIKATLKTGIRNQKRIVSFQSLLGSLWDE